ncbi:hypothetical protein EDD21DRAFT_197795 [Dissophora ornata]|nr:hypothetical protein EDD21DRAFT_197795 [Dissophora ornata]
MFIFDDSIYPIINTPPDPTLLSINPSPPPTSFIQPFIPIPPTKTVNPPLTDHHELLRYPPPKDEVGHGHPRALTVCEVSELSEPLLSLDDLGWFNTLSSSKAPSASASASASSVPATLHQGDASGFDQLSLFDEVCASAFNTPFTPYLDTPDQTPNQTPLFDRVASEDLDMTSLEQLWTAADSNVGVVSSAASGSDLNLSLDLTLPHSAALTTLSDYDGCTAQDPSQLNARLQAETALLDFVLFDDIAPPSPISTLSTPVTTSLTSPSHVDLKVCSLPSFFLCAALCNTGCQED